MKSFLLAFLATAMLVGCGKSKSKPAEDETPRLISQESAKPEAPQLAKKPAPAPIPSTGPAPSPAPAQTPAAAAVAAAAAAAAAAAEVSKVLAAAQAAPVAVPAPILASCDTNLLGITNVKLLSEGIKQRAQAQVLRYELSVSSCKDGSALALNNLPVQFDLNARFSDLRQSLSFVIKNDKDETLSSGSLDPVYGSDLFSNTGNYAFWTSPNVQFSGELAKLIFEVQLLGLEVEPYSADAQMIDSYLKIGEALVVTQALQILD